MTTIDELMQELHHIQAKQSECVNDWGQVKTGMREDYNILVKRATEIHDSIEVIRGCTNRL